MLLTLMIFFYWTGPVRAMDLENKVIKAKLNNGLTILMLERKFSPTVSLYIRHRIGAVDKVKGQSGAAHFLEHMMFKGTTTIGTKNYAAEKRLLIKIEKTGQALDNERLKQSNSNRKLIEQLSARLKQLQDEHRRYYVPNEIDRLYTENGGLGMNAATGQDVTTYFVSLPSNKIELWARIEADRLLNPVFREFYTERDVIMEERRQSVESKPDGKLYESFMHKAYAVHPYGVPILGEPQDLAYMSQAAIRHIHHQYLSPENIVIAVVGDIDPQKILKLIDQYFGRIPKSKYKPADIPAEPPQTGERKVEVLFDASPSMIIGYHKPTAPAAEDYAFDVLETILSKGRTSRLYSRLVLQMQIADSISVQN
ncbi:MAG: insulinase family protein, partial [Deltaproteobacteria bacterium HGW-Deltaproteobacteria-7]